MITKLSAGHSVHQATKLFAGHFVHKAPEISTGCHLHNKRCKQTTHLGLPRRHSIRHIWCPKHQLHIWHRTSDDHRRQMRVQRTSDDRQGANYAPGAPRRQLQLLCPCTTTTQSFGDKLRISLHAGSSSWGSHSAQRRSAKLHEVVHQHGSPTWQPLGPILPALSISAPSRGGFDHQLLFETSYPLYGHVAKLATTR